MLAIYSMRIGTFHAELNRLFIKSIKLTEGFDGD